jgi:hypothetical protein
MFLRRALFCMSVVVTLVSVSAPTAMAQSWPDPLKPTTDSKGHPVLGGFLEDEFQKMVFQCTNSRMHVEKPKMFGSTDTKEISAIPSGLATELNLNDSVFVQSDEKITNSFAYVYSDAETKTEQHSDSTSYLPLNYERDPSQLTQVGVSGIDLSNSCSTVFGAAAQVSSGYSLPIASIKAALTSDYNNSTSYRLDLVKGQFVSPVVQMLHGSSVDQTFANLMLWNWYATHPNRAAQANWILQQFRGIALYRVGGNKVNTQTTVNVGGSTALPYVSAEGVAKASFRNTTDLQLQSFKSVTFLRTDGSPDRDFYQLPDPSAIADNVLKSVNVGLHTTASDLTLYDGGARVHYQDATGIPSVMCDRQKWSVPADPTAPISLVSVTPNTRDNGRSVCTFGVEFRPDAASIQSGKTLNYKFVNTFNGNGNPYSLAIPATATYTASSVPRLSYNGSTQYWSQNKKVSPAGTNYYELSWNEQFQIIDNNLLKPDNSAIDVSGLNLTCPSQVAAQPIITATRKAGPSGTQLLDVSLVGQYNDSLQDPATTNSYQQCALQGNVAYSFVSGSTVSKALPTNVIYYPTKQVVTVLNVTLQPATQLTAPTGTPAPVQTGIQPSIAGEPNKAIFNLPVGTQPR